MTGAAADRARPTWDRMLRLSPRRALLVLAAWVAAVLAHNLVYGLLYRSFPEGWDEPVFFVLAVLVIPGYALVAFVYTVIVAVRRRARA